VRWSSNNKNQKKKKKKSFTTMERKDLKRIRTKEDVMVNQLAAKLKQWATDKNVEIVEHVGTSMPDKVLMEISNTLLRQIKSLRVVDFKDNHITASGLASICRALGDCHELCYLRMSRNLLNGSAAKTLFETFADHTKLQILRLSNNQLLDWGAVAIAKLLKVNNVLNLVSLSRNCIGDSGLEALAEALRTNKSLRCLYLTGNIFSCKGIARLSNAMKENSALKVLKIDDCRIGNMGALKLAEMFEENSKCGLTYVKYRPGNVNITSEGESTMNKYIFKNGYVRHNGDTLNQGTMIVGDALLVNAVPGGDDGIAILLANVAQDPRDEIRHLQMSFNDIDDKVLDSLGYCWSTAGAPICYLHSIKVSHNTHITSKGMTTFIKSLKPLKYLEILHISDVCFSDF